MQDIIKQWPILSLLPMCTTDVGLSILIYKAITVLRTSKITKMALVNMYLTIGGMKIRVLGYTPEILSL